MGRTTINVSDDVLKKLLRIKKIRPQDISRNETVNFVLDFFLERQINPFQDIRIPIIDAEKPRSAEEFKKHSELLKGSGTGFVQLGQVKKP